MVRYLIVAVAPQGQKTVVITTKVALKLWMAKQGLVFQNGKSMAVPANTEGSPTNTWLIEYEVPMLKAGDLRPAKPTEATA